MKVSLQDSSDAVAYYGLTISQWVTLGAVIATLIVGMINLFSSLHTNKRTTFVNAVTSERVKWMAQLRELISEYLMLTTYYDQKPLLKGEGMNSFFERLIFLKHRIKLHLNHSGKEDNEINSLIEKINDKLFNFYRAQEMLEIPEKDRLSFAIKNYFDHNKQLESMIHQVLEKHSLKVEDLLSDEGEIVSVLKHVIDLINDDFKREFGYRSRDELVSLTNKLVNLSGLYLKEEWEKVKKEAKEGQLKK
ncbi:hypothetical protein [Paenibacillus sp. FSL M7-0134]|uniref:hypothetical protein n=1 Tax=Paenibacillus sp. FSL M7-0134 TaxID=2954754 RepID=UPI0030FABF15